jgi:hypothetical protein
MEVNFKLSNHRKPLAKKAPFMGQENSPLQSFGAVRSRARSGSELYLVPSTTSLLSPEQSPEKLWISLQICKTAKTLIRKMQYLLHPNSVFSKLGLLENLRKSTTTLCRETPRSVKREKTKFGEECEPFQSEEPVKPLNSKTQ